MLCVEDYLDALRWCGEIGGIDSMIKRSSNNLAVLAKWVDATDWIDFLAARPEIRSNTSICLKFTSPAVQALSAEQQATFAKRIVELLETERVAMDINAYRSAPPGLRIWGGATVESQDIEALIPWIEWAHSIASAEL